MILEYNLREKMNLFFYEVIAPIYMFDKNRYFCKNENIINLADNAWHYLCKQGFKLDIASLCKEGTKIYADGDEEDYKTNTTQDFKFDFDEKNKTIRIAEVYPNYTYFYILYNYLKYKTNNKYYSILILLNVLDYLDIKDQFIVKIALDTKKHILWNAYYKHYILNENSEYNDIFNYNLDFKSLEEILSVLANINDFSSQKDVLLYFYNKILADYKKDILNYFNKDFYFAWYSNSNALTDDYKIKKLCKEYDEFKEKIIKKIKNYTEIHYMKNKLTYNDDYILLDPEYDISIFIWCFAMQNYKRLSVESYKYKQIFGLLCEYLIPALYSPYQYKIDYTYIYKVLCDFDKSYFEYSFEELKHISDILIPAIIKLIKMLGLEIEEEIKRLRTTTRRKPMYQKTKDTEISKSIKDIPLVTLPGLNSDNTTNENNIDEITEMDPFDFDNESEFNFLSEFDIIEDNDLEFLDGSESSKLFKELCEIVKITEDEF